ncbi:hypothetical protein C8R43DRAFT_981668 [Mycena crocata]|nr:hypothetical protein C8R43DRAFT_981668 [Mycena crocata]
MSTIQSILSESTPSDDALHVHIPPPYRLRDDSPYRNLSLREKVRPLPRPPTLPLNTGVNLSRPLPRRRASGGGFVNPQAPKTTTFFVCNPSDSPISPLSPLTPGQPSMASQLGLPIHITPATPLPPPTPGLVQSKSKFLPPDLDSTLDPLSPSSTTPQIPIAKRHRRFGGSVGSISPDFLAQLRSMGEENDTSQPAVNGIQRDDDSSSSEDDDDEDELGEEADSSWVVEKATRGVRRTDRSSLKWVQDLGGDRWIADRYSTLLRAL